MHCCCGTNNRAPRWTFTNPCTPEVRPSAREVSVKVTMHVYVWEQIVSPYYRSAWLIFTKIGRDEVIMALHKVCWPYLPRGGSGTEVLIVLRWAIKAPWGSSFQLFFEPLNGIRRNLTRGKSSTAVVLFREIIHRNVMLDVYNNTKLN